MQHARDAFEIDDDHVGEIEALLNEVYRSSQEALAALDEAEGEIKSTRAHFCR